MFQVFEKTGLPNIAEQDFSKILLTRGNETRDEINNRKSCRLVIQEDSARAFLVNDCLGSEVGSFLLVWQERARIWSNFQYNFDVSHPEPKNKARIYAKQREISFAATDKLPQNDIE